VLENVITCDETWIFQYDPEKKKEAIDTLEDTHFTKNEKSMNDQVECEGNGDRFLQHQRRNLY
jgi:hypothetical protein